MATSERLSIVSLTHDLVNQRSIALINWDDVADRRLCVAVPFDTKLKIYCLPFKPHWSSCGQN
jgi:hypothetical protein